MANIKELDEYQLEAWESALPSAKNLDYLILGLASEAGEVAGKRKKQMRGDSLDDSDMLKELGDVLWYVAGIATLLDCDLCEIAQQNIDKLNSRNERGKIKGNGDNR